MMYDDKEKNLKLWVDSWDQVVHFGDFILYLYLYRHNFEESIFLIYVTANRFKTLWGNFDLL